MIKKLIIIFEIVFIAGIGYALFKSFSNASNSMIKSNVLSYIEAIEKQAILNEMSDSIDNISNGIFDISDYKIEYGGQRPNKGVYKTVENDVDQALLYYKINNKSYYACYAKTKVEITKKIDNSSECYDLSNELK